MAVGGGAGYVLRKNVAEGKLASAEEKASRMIKEAEETIEAKKKESLMEAKDEIHRLRSDMERENKERRNDLQRQERRLVQKEENLDRKIDAFEKKEENLTVKESKLNAAQEKIDALYQRQLQELERLSGLSSEDAKQELLAAVRDDVQHDTAVMIKEMEQRAKDEADKKARDIIALAIQRCAADQVAETTVSVVSLPNDEMKGRIIGREGRNIRTLETLTGKQLLFPVLTPYAGKLPASPLKSSSMMDGFIRPVSKKWLKKPRKKLSRTSRKPANRQPLPLESTV